MSQNVILLLQSLLIFAQMVNAGLEAVVSIPPLVSLIVAAFVGALQFYVQHLGNQSMPPGAGTGNANPK